MRRVSWKGIQRRTKSAQRQTKVVARCPIEAMTAERAACVFTDDQRGEQSLQNLSAVSRAPPLPFSARAA
jgi:hypothetical protein